MPQAYITVEYPGASPEAIEDDVIKPIENVINSIDGVRNIYATAREGSAFFQIEFRLETDIIAATQEDPRQGRADPLDAAARGARAARSSAPAAKASRAPSVELVVYSGTRSLREVSTLVEQQIVKRLQNSYGVGHIEVGGSVRAAGADFPAPRAAAEPARRRRPGDRGDPRREPGPAGRQHLARRAASSWCASKARSRTRAVSSASSSRNQGGAPVYLGQVADIVDGEAEEQSIARVNGMRSVSLSVYQRPAGEHGRRSAPASRRRSQSCRAACPRTSRSARCGRTRSGSKARSTASRRRSSKARCSRS